MPPESCDLATLVFVLSAISPEKMVDALRNIARVGSSLMVGYSTVLCDSVAVSTSLGMYSFISRAVHLWWNMLSKVAYGITLTAFIVLFLA